MKSTFKITYLTKTGKHSIFLTDSKNDFNEKIKNLFKQRIEATAYKNNSIVGHVFLDDESKKWKWILED